MLGGVRAPFAPVFHGWGEGPAEALLVLEDLSDAHWPPPYPRDPTALFEALAGVAAHPPPSSLRPVPPKVPSWPQVRAQPGPFLDLDVCQPSWFARYAAELEQAEAAAEPHGEQPVHFDVWSGNVCFAPRGVVLVDWAEARRGNAALDVAFAVLSVLAEGGERPPGLRLPDEAAWASYLAGDLALRAPQPLPDWAEPDSTLQDDLRGDLAHALRWTAAALELPPPHVP